MNHSDIVLREWELLEALICGKNSAKVVLTGRTLSIPDVVAVARFVGPTILYPTVQYTFV
jgi:hypothetical protein